MADPDAPSLPQGSSMPAPPPPAARRPDSTPSSKLKLQLFMKLLGKKVGCCAG
eukprot:CAMPEP_0181194230 /NCGR_PEP_ID=MMETSP1096-20121128/14229_1 /TAXON_ID=156174 ORGANISM="Chrysochromulina ericina, Strain CCMP281" /NCGR_SAMPLE_ID=MMETSP1096 /ASSEMBLY_ACC=CAM_ASM_000453 /LENGTH=52 /DNA_ID=CAMNT_0023283725 /DNA_START=23 /DNA_END=181 /DNA_ORIENTATION=+